MAYNKTPMQDTYQTKSIPLMQTFETRSPDGTKDVENQNVIWDLIKDVEGQYFEAMKRDGTRVWATVPTSPIKGMHWRSAGSGVLVITASQAYFYDRNGVLQVNYPIGFSFGSGDIVRITEFLYENGDISYIATDGVLCYEVKTSGVTLIADPDFPQNNHLPFPVFLDGYLFIATPSGQIYNSNLNNPQAWSASDIITAESYADGLEAIARHGQYIVAFGRDSIQFFYDAANPTGTPLAAQTSAPRIGYVGGLAPAQDSLYFIGQGSNTKEAIYVLKSLEPEEIVSFPISRRIAEDGVEAELEDTYGNILVFNGHALFTWATSDSNGVDTTPTYALDIQTRQWCSLAFQGTPNFRVKCAAYNLDGANFGPSAGRVSGSLFCFNDSNLIYEVQSDISQDAGVDYTVRFTTRNTDFGTRRMKFGSRVLIDCDQTPSSSNLGISWTNDDYQTFTSVRNIDVANTYAVLHQLGQFRKIAFRVTYTDNFPMRWKSLELDYNQGGQ